MTPSELEQKARERYNSVGDTFYSESEIMGLIYAGCEELATETLCIERIYTTTTVASTQEYAFPTNTISIKRVTYNGKKLTPISMRESDTLFLNSGSTAIGEPMYYAIWNQTIILYPTPDAAETLKIYSVNEPSEVDTTSTLEVPVWTHTRLINYLVRCMAEKDQNFQAATYYGTLWENDKKWIKRQMRKQKRGDAFGSAFDDDNFRNTVLGTV